MALRTEDAGDETVGLDRLSTLAARPDDFSSWIRDHAKGAVVRIASGKNAPAAFIVDEQTLSAAATAVAVLQIVHLGSPFRNAGRGHDAYGDLLRHARAFDSLPGVRRTNVNKALVELACSFVPTGLSHDAFAQSIEQLEPREMAVEIKRHFFEYLGGASPAPAAEIGRAAARTEAAAPGSESFGIWDRVEAYARADEDEVVRVGELSPEDAERLLGTGPFPQPAAE